jgi:NAD+ kinase
LKLRGQAPKAVRWARLEQRYQVHKQCVEDLLKILKGHHVNLSCVNRVELDRQHLADIDLMIAVGGDGTVLSAAHFLDHGTIPLLGINSDPNVRKEDRIVKSKQSDERRSHGALCMCTSVDMDKGVEQALYNGDAAVIQNRTRIRCKVKSTFCETSMVPALNDILLANPSPAAVSRFRLGWLHLIPPTAPAPVTSDTYGTVTRFGTKAYSVTDSINVWSSGMWVCTATGSTAAMKAAGGQPMPHLGSSDLQYLIREHILEQPSSQSTNVLSSSSLHEASYIDKAVDNAIFPHGEKLHVRWNSQRGRIFIDGSHLFHNLELGDEILIDNAAPPLQIFARHAFV